MEWKKNWRLVLIVTVANIMFSGLVAFAVNVISAREVSLQGSASLEYVDKQDSAIGLTLIRHESEIHSLNTKIDTKADKIDVAAVQVTVNDIYKLLLQMATQKQIDKAETIK